MTEQDTTEHEQAGRISNAGKPNRTPDAAGQGRVSDATSVSGESATNAPAESSQIENIPEEEVSTEHPREPDAFSRRYVKKLRDENARYRQRAKQADDYAHRLHTALTAATGRLADPTDLEFDPDHLEDQDALTEALDDLLARKPHLAARRPHGSIGQGAQPHDPSSVDLAGLLRAGAGG
ncbi:hypothetical protein [Nesterenkonia aerolata]|uniref:Uncharacterized protein n=1 Tax=Nesterenkonia aerolata TaxID=3074079 RepID=A0ABU2DNW0_9MICC|nr:hypothetical protein [Nesterenkonia sp. LY-0111]MDR8018202.1 hypothetical protein [Nesterenkonia sp. LY-0111]